MFIKKFVIASSFLLGTTSLAHAEVITFNTLATDSFSQQSTRFFQFPDRSELVIDNLEYTAIQATNFSVGYNIDFGAQPSESPFWNTVDHAGFGENYEQDGIAYSSWTSLFRAQRLNDTPFTSGLTSAFPERDQFPATTSSSQGARLLINSVVATNINTGEIIQDESFEFLRISESDSFRNQPEDTDYGFELLFNLNLDRVFLDTEATRYSQRDILNMIVNNSGAFRYNEFTKLGNYDPVNDTESDDYFGYVGSTLSATVVSESQSILLFLMAFTALLRIRSNDGSSPYL